MVYGMLFNMYLVNDDTSNEFKIKKLKEISLDNLLTLLRNIEENSKRFDQEIINAVYGELHNRGITCV